MCTRSSRAVRALQAAPIPRDTPAPLEQIIRMASLTPAERAGVARTLGSLEVGKRADLLVLDRDLHVKRVFLDGLGVV